ncbi:MAG: hypothetical protein C1943_14295 [Halochromatium sp.]|nr:hypothetical protein [Halochromatium sp.]
MLGILPTRLPIPLNAKSGSDCMPSIGAWIDTGCLVALFARDDPHHPSAVSFLESNQRLTLHSIWPVVTEAGFFLDTAGKIALAIRFTPDPSRPSVGH